MMHNTRLFSIAPVLLILLLIVVGQPADAQITRYVTMLPATVTSGNYTGDQDIAAVGFYSDGRIETDPMRPRVICSQTYKEFAPAALSDGFGGFFLAYTIEHTDSTHKGDRDVLMRRVNRDFQDVWGDSTRRMVSIAQSQYRESAPHIIGLPDGSMIITYEFSYSSQPDSDDADVVAVKINRDGERQWERGVWIANSKRSERIAGAVSDGRGGAIIVLEVSWRGDSGIVNHDILAAHVDGSGKVGWTGTSTDPLPIAASRHLERNPSIVADGYGGLFIAYEIEYVGGERAGDVDILAQHLSSLGIREWINETSLPVVSSDARAKERNPVVMLDNAGLFVAFHIGVEDAAGSREFVGIQKMDLLGRAVWNEGKNAMLIATPRARLGPVQITTDRLGGAYLVMEAYDSLSGDRDIHAQRIGPNGNQLWGDGEGAIPIAVLPDIERTPSIIPDTNGDLLIVSIREEPVESSARTNIVLAQKFHPDGSNAWEALAGPVVLTRTTMQVIDSMLIRSQ